jgi:hypothetical protein
MSGRCQEERERIQGGVMALVLSRSPRWLNEDTIAREIGDREAAERAVDELVAVGLLYRVANLVVPTPAALHFNRLDVS